MAFRDNVPVNPTTNDRLELPNDWAGLDSNDVGFLNRILRGLHHIHAPGGALESTGGRFVSSDYDVDAGGLGSSPNNWVKVSGGDEVAVEFGSPSITLPKSGIVLINAFIQFQASGTNPCVVGDRLYAWLVPGSQYQEYLDVVRVTGASGGPEVHMHLRAFQPAGEGLNTFNVFFSPVLDSLNAPKTVRRGTSLEITGVY